MVDINSFINVYPVSRTLCWRLIPIGNTAKNIEELRILESDYQKSQLYHKAKNELDSVYKDFINSSLSDYMSDDDIYDPVEFIKLADLVKASQTDRIANRDALSEQFRLCRKAIIDHMSKKPDFKIYEKGSEPKKILKLAYTKDRQLKETFDKFSVYFMGYCTNRANLFSSEAKASAIANRLINENFPKYCRNTSVLKRIETDYPELYSLLSKSMKDRFECDLSDFFSIGLYPRVFTQMGIDRYNLALGGRTEKTAGLKEKGLNELINLFCQSNPEVKRRELILEPLYKQLLEDRERMSFIPRQCKSDDELFDVIGKSKAEAETVNGILCRIRDFRNFDLHRIFVSNREIPSISILVNGTGKWNHLFDAMVQSEICRLASTQSRPLTKKQLSDAEKIRKIDFYSLEYLSEISRSAMANDSVDLYEVIERKSKELAGNLQKTLSEIGLIPRGCDLRSDSDSVAILKRYLDSLIAGARFIRAFIPDSAYDKDVSFYCVFDGFDDVYRQIVTEYDFARNYVTKKAEKSEKYKLNFNCATLGNGWDRSKERENLCIILRRDDKYYLAIRNKLSETSILVNSDNCPVENGEPFYDKMVYKLIPNPISELPHVFFSKTGKESSYAPSESLIMAHDANKTNRKDFYSENYNSEREYYQDLIRFYISAIPKYRDWGEFNMRFAEPESYESVSDFYADVKKQSFFIRFERVSAKSIDRLVDSGDLFLFQIYNKDYAEGATGKKNLHTMIWEYMFSDENLNSTRVMKLNGGAELFFRPASKGEPVTHPKGSFIVNRNTKSGEHIPDKYHKEIYDYANGRIANLSPGAREWHPKVVIKQADRELVKGQRFYCDQYSFHVSLTINHNADDHIDINHEVNNMLRINPCCNVIGIDRGERNLLYISVINQKGKILHQETLNTITETKGGRDVTIDYISKLVDAEISRDEARKSWASIGKIADLKEGYLSAAVTKIVRLMARYNAIVVLENLNVGFKRGRFKVERQVYQKFEAALINKLGLLISKNTMAGLPMSVACPLQLAGKFESFEKMGVQNGWVYYVPAAYTSKIDPTTGFVDIFNRRDLTNFEKKKDFFTRFRRIAYDSSSGDFSFQFDYADFPCQMKIQKGRVWQLSSQGERIVHQKDGASSHVIPTDELRKAFDVNGVHYSDGHDLIGDISRLEHTNSNITMMDEIYRAFCHILQMRNSSSETGEDYILSPVFGPNGYYDSRNYDVNGVLPCDADANGAYNIARKGLLIIEKLKAQPNKNKPNMTISNDEWIWYCQNLWKPTSR